MQASVHCDFIYINFKLDSQWVVQDTLQPGIRVPPGEGSSFAIEIEAKKKKTPEKERKGERERGTGRCQGPSSRRIQERERPSYM